jgi:bifunctional DNA-binding transcriptional regulator/antitoxin component of YhaV-PrlF toxin-antitoxin module
MLAKKTSKTQITLPKAVVRQLPNVQYFDISVRDGEIILRPAVVSASGDRLKAVRDKMRALGLSKKDVDDAIPCARRRRR